MSARLEVIQQNDSRPWDDLVRDYLKTGKKETLWKALQGCPFTKDLPFEVVELVCEGFDHDSGMDYMKALPMTRRQRKKLMASNAWVVHLFAGEPSGQDDPLRMVERSGKADRRDKLEALGLASAERGVSAASMGSSEPQN